MAPVEKASGEWLNPAATTSGPLPSNSTPAAALAPTPPTATAAAPAVPLHTPPAHHGNNSIASIKLDLPIGAVVATNKDRYTIISYLSSCGLSKLYLVVNSNKARRVMRVEYCKIPRVASRIKAELSLLSNLTNVERDKRSHFLTLYDRGRTPIFKFLVVNQVGPTLLQIREKLLEQDDFTEYTAFYIAVGTIQALRDLHALGFVHRDVNLARFSIGLGGYEKQIYAYNLKDIKRYSSNGRHIQRIRDEIPFNGSLLFSSRNAMFNIEQSRRDDLESWLYMVFDVYDRQTFTTYFESRKFAEVVEVKSEILEGRHSKNFYKKIPKLFVRMCHYIKNMEWDADPDYDHILDILQQVMPSTELRRNDYLDWTAKIEMREEYKEMQERIISTKKPTSRPDIVCSNDISDSEGSGEGEEQHTPKEAAMKEKKDRTTVKSTRSVAEKSGRKKVTAKKDNRKRASKERLVSRREGGERSMPPTSENVSENENSKAQGRRASMNRKPRKCPSRSEPPRSEVVEPDMGGAFPGNPAIISAKMQEAAALPHPTTSKENMPPPVTMAEKQKRAERLRRQMHVNVTDTSEEDVKFNFLTGKK